MAFGSYPAKKLYPFLVFFCISFFAPSGVLWAASPGDLNSDGIVYWDDFAIIAQHWLSGSCGDEDGWCGGADINRSSDVDFADYSVLANNWLQTTNSPSLELYPTINCVGIRLSYPGNPQHKVEYRLAGTSSWQPGHFLTAIGNSRLAGSIFWLKPNSIYQVRITIGNQVFTGAVTTRADSPPESVGATYYVATDGNDANPGTITNPFATIGKAVSIVQAGDTVIVRNGTYHETLIITASGTLTNPIHFKSETPLGAVIDGNGVTTIPIVRLSGSNNIILEGFMLQNAADAMEIINSSYNWITGNDISCTEEGIQLLQNTTTNNVVQYNHIWDTTPGGASSGRNTAVNMEAGRGSIIRGNNIYGFSNGIGSGHLIDAGLDQDESINPDIDVYENTISGIGDDCLEPEGTCINDRLWDNHLSNSFVAISIAPIWVGPTYAIRNTAFDCTPIKFHAYWGCGPAYVYHYTSFRATKTGYGLKTSQLGGIRDVVFRNCIFHAIDSYVLYGPGADLDYNLWFYTGSNPPFKWGNNLYSTLEAFQTASGEEAHGLMGDPLFADPCNQDYRIPFASPARNRGVYIPGVNDDYKGTAPDMGAFEFEENERPLVNAGLDQSIVDPNNSVILNATVTDDGLPNPPQVVTTLWTKQSGPGTVTFGDANAVDTTAVFSTGAIGQYVLRLTASDGELSSFDEITVNYYPDSTLNQPPDVNAGSDQTVTLPESANLDGTVTDDGLPNPPGVVTVTWTKRSGPGSVTFGDIHAVDTTASFSIDGTYVLRLTANDNALQAYGEVTITVNFNPVPNQAPSVNAGTDQTITLPAGANLDCTITDDGLPNPPGVVTTLWTKQSGPGTVTFVDANATNTTASFTLPGTYVLRLTADDNELQAYDQVTITVNSPPASCQLLAGTSAGWTFTDPNTLLQTIYGTAQNSSGNITANTYRAISLDKGLAMAFQIPQDTTLDKGIFKVFSNPWRNGENLRIRLFDVTGKGYLNYNHSGITKASPGGGNPAIVDVIATTPNPVPYHLELGDGRQYTDMVINFGPLPVTAGEYFITFDCQGPSNTWGSMVRGGSATVSDNMGKYPDGSPLPKRATVTISGTPGNTYYYQLDATSSTSYSASSCLFVFQMLTQ